MIKFNDILWKIIKIPIKIIEIIEIDLGKKKILKSRRLNIKVITKQIDNELIIFFIAK